MGIPFAKKLQRYGRFALMFMTFGLACCASTAPRPVYQPAPGSYFTVSVEKGDHVSEIARRYQVGEEDVLAINAIDNRDAPVQEKTVRIPAYGHLKDPRMQKPRSARRDVVVDSQPLPPPKGARGGAAGGRSQKPAGGVQTADISGKGANAGAKGARAVPSDTAVTKSGKGGKVQTANNVPPQTAPWWNPFSTVPAPKENPVPSRKFLWPVQGRLLSQFGVGQGGERNDGINIQARAGTPIRAADAGTVTYVGNELKGYGNLVLIRHDSAYVTAYAHADTVAVNKGDAVKRGQIIAYTGATGDVTQPQLHFEIRLNTKPVDPQPYLVTNDRQIASN